jgi:hypothetical protein
MKFKQFFYLLCGLFYLAFLLGISTECKTELIKLVSFEELLKNPANYNDRQIVLEGYYFHGFEIQVMAENLKQSGYTENHFAPDGNMVWVEGGIPINIYDQLFVQSMTGPEERYGKVRITGKFKYGGQYGHLGSYASQIIPDKMEVLEWIP